MTTADSTAPGYLTPLVAISDDDAMLDLLQPIVAGIGGYSDTSAVRPRWQAPDTPNQPLLPTDWCSLGIKNTREETYHYEVHVDSGTGYDVFEYSEEVDLLISCYGPNSGAFSRTLRDGFRVEQNRAPLQALNIDVLYTGNLVTLPMLLHGKWLRRVDVTICLRRRVSQQYAVRTVVGIAALTSTIDNEVYKTPIAPLP